ncbi:MAG: methyltransferase domain-containing protein [Myxococcales bacterium]|nr:methyltransferase domain-containing protein [Myxococcales bacterium]
MTQSYLGSNSITQAYDAWTQDGVLEHFWGEHIHHGYYPDHRWWQQDFKRAKIELLDQLTRWTKLKTIHDALDVGCGIGGSARYLAERWPNAEVTGVTLSPAQMNRATELTPSHMKVSFKVADALELPFPDSTFDLVWSCESGEHMPDKEVFLREMVRVLRPGGHLVIATWCHRSEPPALSAAEQHRLQRIYHAWALPFFVSIPQYETMANAHPELIEIRTSDWTTHVRGTWPHQIWMGLGDLPWLLRQGWAVVRRSLRDVVAIWHMIRGYQQGSIRYGVIHARKRDTKCPG